MDFNHVLTILACMVIVYIVGKLFALPIKSMIKLVLNSVLGGILIYIINLIGGIWEFTIGLNFVTAIFVGILGLPGAVLLVILRLILG